MKEPMPAPTPSPMQEHVASIARQTEDLKAQLKAVKVEVEDALRAGDSSRLSEARAKLAVIIGKLEQAEGALVMGEAP